MGELEYRGLRFEHEILDTDNYQGVAVVNYTKKDIPYTRSIEHKHFNFGKQNKTIVSKEYPVQWDPSKEPYYPINDEANTRKYQAYRQLAQSEKKVIFEGRLGSYRYTDMQDTVRDAMVLWQKIQNI